MPLALFRSLLMLVVLTGSSAALAQSPVCRQIAGELQATGRASGQGAQQAAGIRQQLAEISRGLGQLGCNGGGLFGQPPAQCLGLRQQAHQLAGHLQQLEARNRQAGNDTRRRQLEDSYAAHDCAGAGRIDSVRAIYGVEAARPTYATPTLPDGRTLEDVTSPPANMPAEAAPRRSGTAICVRTCDGFFFPVNFHGADGHHADICRASCPGAEAEVFQMPASGSLEDAVSPRGVKYTALPAAFRYRKALDPACSCKSGGGASMSQTMARAESVMRRKGDIVVTAESSARLANPEQTPLRGLNPDAEMATGALRPPERHPARGEDPFEPLPRKR